MMFVKKNSSKYFECYVPGSVLELYMYILFNKDSTPEVGTIIIPYFKNEKIEI